MEPTIRKSGLLQMPPDIQNAIQTLRTNIQFAGIDHAYKSIAVTSAVPSEGKSTVALLLAVSMAEAGKRTLIVDCDCRRPMIGNRLNVRPQYTWLDILAKGMPLSAVAVQTQQPNLFFLDAEPQLPHAVELIASNRFAQLMQDADAAFDVVIYDTPPLGSFIEAAVLASKVDGTLLVISTGKVNVSKEREVLEQLKKVSAHIIGAVLNGVKGNKNSDYYYYYYNRGEKHKRKRRKEDGSRLPRSAQAHKQSQPAAPADAPFDAGKQA